MNKNEEAMITKLKRSTTEVLLLSLLSQHDMYGYQLTANETSKQRLMQLQRNNLLPYFKQTSESEYD